MDWKKIAERRLFAAQVQVREAKEALSAKNKDSHARYEAALKELAAAERFMMRIAKNDPIPVEEGHGLFS